MTRKEFLGGAAAITAAAAAPGWGQSLPSKRPRAITMWEFSWLERRWDGAGYEDWDRALDELVERGYDAVRIDPYPHLIAAGAERDWTLQPFWTTQMWGAPDLVTVKVLPSLFRFMGKCRDRGIKVALSSWYREDAGGALRKRITSPEVLAGYWISTLKAIQKEGLLDSVLYADLCNEWPLVYWASFFPGASNSADWWSPASLEWMRRAIAPVRRSFPDIPLLFSLFNEDTNRYIDHPLPEFDAFEHHLWMAQQNGGEYYREVGYDYERFDNKGYRALSLKAEPVYRARPAYWQGLLRSRINRLAAASLKVGKPLATTECWALVDYKDWPSLRWDWIKELNAVGVETAAGTGRWLAIATSNFCGPQFVGMWRDVAWHRRMTDVIRSSAIARDLRGGRLWDRL